MCANTCHNITRMPSIETTMGSTTNSLAFFAEEEKRENCSKAFMAHEDDCTKYLLMIFRELTGRVLYQRIPGMIRNL